MSLTLYYAPRTRSFTALWLLEELGVPYTLESFDLNTGRHKENDFLALNPMGKVPLVVDDGVPVSELGAIAIYLSDRCRNVVLSPAIDAPERAAFLRWIFFASAIMEPTFGEKIFKWTIPARSVAWGSFDDMLRTLIEGLDQSVYLLGDSFSAADVLVGANARFGLMFGALPKDGPVAAYVNRLSEREAFGRALAIEQREAERFPFPEPSGQAS